MGVDVLLHEMEDLDNSALLSRLGRVDQRELADPGFIYGGGHRPADQPLEAVSDSRMFQVVTQLLRLQAGFCSQSQARSPEERARLIFPD
jgi:hypothetical protein